ncbi:MAG: hypothetical protein P8170_22590 [Gemmatimonadota bacterium]
MRISPVVFATLLALPMTSCQEPTAPAAPLDVSPSMGVTNGHGRVIQHISIGSNDLCRAMGQKPGCDANFSLVANKWADGTVKGQWQDGFGKDENGEQLGGVHVSIDCLRVEDYNIGIYSWPIAWVSGVVTRSSSPHYGVGDGVITLALDRGSSANDPFEDLASLTVPLSGFPAGTTCMDGPDLPVFLNVPFTGQVKIWYR